MLTKKQQEIYDEITGKIMRYFGKTIEDATEMMVYKACAYTVRDEIMRKWQQSHAAVKEMRQKSSTTCRAEFLMGRLLGTNSSTCPYGRL